jgi:hypothetical protein
MIDLFIEFVALVAHGNPLEPRTEPTLIGCLMVSTAGMGICSLASTGNQKGPLLKIKGNHSPHGMDDYRSYGRTGAAAKMAAEELSSASIPGDARRDQKEV